MSKIESFRLPDLKEIVAFRPNEQDKKNLRLLMMDRRETNVSQLLRDLIEEAAKPTRKRWKDNAKRIAELQGDES